MLICELILSPDDKKGLLEKAYNDDSLWVVSDLQSKLWLQKKIRAKSEASISSERVLRASELWLSLWLRMAPTWQVVNPQMSLFLIEKWMREDGGFSPKDRQKAYDTVTQLLPLLTHFEGAEALQEWFSEREDAQVRWENWYQLGRSLWEKFKSKEMIPSEWVSGLLLHEDLKLPRKRPLVFDLGIQLGDVESELILNLSREVDVTVIVPHEEGGENTSAYEPLLGRAQLHKYEKQPVSNRKVFKKLPTMLSEVKEAVAQVRKWLDEGVPAEEIAILSSAIENYWATLSEYLIVEGIDFRKATVAPLSQFDHYNKWLSTLKLSLQEAESVDGKQYFFLNQEEPQLSFSEYEHLYENIYDTEDFQRGGRLAGHLPPEKVSEEMTLAQFLEWAVGLWPHKDRQALELLLPHFDDNLLVQEKLTTLKWVEYLEYFLARKEKTLEPEKEEGIYVLNPQSAENIPLKNVVFMGLSEKNLSQSSQTSLQLSDIESLKIQFGFSLPHAERQGKLFQLKWVAEKSFSESLFLHSEMDFTGRFQAPSLFWLQQALELQQDTELQSPLRTRWDELMEKESRVESPYEEKTNELVENSIAKEKTGEIEPIPQPEVSLSASMLEEYFQCPFKFYAQKVLKLSQLPSLDLDIDYMTRGRLLHKICELIVQGDNFSLGDEELVRLVEKAKKEIDLGMGDDKLWPSMREFYIHLARTFMSFERQWRQDYPKTQTDSLELPIKGYIQGEGELLFTKEPHKSGHSYRGVVDRIDRDPEGRFYVLDYKSSDHGTTQYKSWLEKGELQLSLYAMALEQGLGKSSAEVLGAAYFIVKDQNRKKGFNTNKDPDFMNVGKLDSEDKKEIYQDMKEVTQQLIQSIDQGHFSPKPKDEKICTDCQWKTLCRYPQLSQ